MDALQKLQRPEEDGHWQQYNSARNIAWKTGPVLAKKMPGLLESIRDMLWESGSAIAITKAGQALPALMPLPP